LGLNKERGRGVRTNDFATRERERVRGDENVGDISPSTEDAPTEPYVWERGLHLGRGECDLVVGWVGGLILTKTQTIQKEIT